MQGVAQCNKKSELHKARFEKLLASAEGGMGMLHRITKPLPWRSGEQVTEEKFDDAQPTRAEVKKQGKKLHWQVITLEHVLEDKPRRNEALRSQEEDALPPMRAEKPQLLRRGTTIHADAAWHPSGAVHSQNLLSNLCVPTSWTP